MDYIARLNSYRNLGRAELTPKQSKRLVKKAIAAAKRAAIEEVLTREPEVSGDTAGS
jgi:hypothetical protein